MRRLDQYSEKEKLASRGSLWILTYIMYRVVADQTAFHGRGVETKPIEKLLVDLNL
jgi:hypothetical protein